MTTLQSRRRLLQCLATAPMLPLGRSTLAAAPLHGGADNPAARFATASFTGMAAPTLAAPAAMATTSVGSTLEVAFSDDSRKRFALAYHPFFRDRRQGAGRRRRHDPGRWLLRHRRRAHHRQVGAGPGTPVLLGLPGRRLDPDACEPRGGRRQGPHGVRRRAVRVHDARSESGRPLRPAAVADRGAHARPGPLHRQADAGEIPNVDTAPAKGLWITCGASLSPWGTHLSSEEYEPDATTIATNSRFRAFSLNLFGDATTAKPYHYGHLPEVTVRPDGTGSIVKHYCLGRISHELVQVMPDRRTVLMGDDATNGGLFVFVADKAADLSRRHPVRRQVDADLGRRPGAGDTRLDQAGQRHQRRDRGPGRHACRPRDIFDVQDCRPARCLVHEDPVRGKVQLGQADARHGQGCCLPRDPSLCGATRAAASASRRWRARRVNVRDRIAYTAMSYIQKLDAERLRRHQGRGPAVGRGLRART